ncbi:MAG: SMP-30/gluconolactonase/LRE family protein [Gammaproteobacteria bacterium]|nr:hypothetical protein [Gammaproteobacteria bacterium]
MTDNKTALGLCAIALVGLSACGSSETGGGTAEPEAAAVDSAEPMPAAVAAVAASDAAGDACASDGEIEYVCGVANAEDIVAVGDTGWLVASRLTPLGGTVGAGGLYLIDVQARTVRDLFPGDSPTLRHDQAMFPSCPGLDLEAFDTHGLAIREREPGVYRLYATSHGAVEAIQAFELDVRGTEPQVAWVGCVPLPEGIWANSVAILSDGGFVTTKFVDDPANPEGFPKILAGEINGEVYEWRPGGEVRAIPGTELSGANGIELSPDERFMYVAAFGGREVVRYDLSTSPPTKVSVSLDVNPDNLRWAPDGTLLTVGGNLAAGQGGWTVYRIDVDAMQATSIGGADGSAKLQGASTALEVDGEIWIGTYNGDRVGIMPSR